MKTIFYFISLSIFLMSACDTSKDTADSEKEVTASSATSYKPGFGFFMGHVQKFHEKLWHAGSNENWKLADFYLHELEETVEDIEEIHPGRKETLLLTQMLPSQIELVEEAVDQKDLTTFKEAYLQLTATCNSCHASSGFDFIEIQAPENNNYSSQVFTKKQ